ncbi:hypothetical protein CLOM_g2707 [Closterium sp. NIES-68]|nr:hypothetical protein CLOM_g2707 [Closterium sp. NIES-68]GJP85302.1 hypothetical protein CLOP_g15412 [Closterium sp. NIES-67]
MVLVLALGDLHVPHRAADLPAKFKSMLLPGKIHHVLSPGNLCIKEVHEYLRSICPDVHVTRGEYDDEAQFPETKVVVVGGFRIGLCHGHQVIPWGDVESLAMLQRQMGVDILITGHTHRFKAYRHQGRLLINPGSATGAYTPTTATAAAAAAVSGTVGACSDTAGDAGAAAPTAAAAAAGGATPLHPSFVLMDVDGARVVVYIYELVGGDVKVDKIEFKKPTAGAVGAQ